MAILMGYANNAIYTRHEGVSRIDQDNFNGYKFYRNSVRELRIHLIPTRRVTGIKLSKLGKITAIVGATEVAPTIMNIS